MVDDALARSWSNPEVERDILQRIETYGVLFLERLPDGSIRGFGTGTLVQYAGHFGILTARHVLDTITAMGPNVLYAPTVGTIVRNEARESGSEGVQPRQPWYFRGGVALIVAQGEEEIVRSDGEIVVIATNDRTAYRPDLGVMLITEKMRSNLASTSSFYSLEKGKKDYDDTAGVDPEEGEGCYMIMGVLGRRQEQYIDAYGERVDQPMVWCLQSTTGKRYSRPATDYVYDYRNFLVTDSEGNPDTKSGTDSWGGISGSGVWEVVAQLADGDDRRSVVEHRVILSGVAFAEEWVRVRPAEGPPDVIYCHSDRSIYPRVIDMLTMNLSKVRS